MAKSPTKRPRGKAAKDISPSSVRMPPEVYDAARRAAAAEDRSISSLVVHALRTWLAERGYLSQAEAKPKPKRPRRAS